LGSSNQSHYFNSYNNPINSQTLFFRPKLRIEFDQENDPNTFAPAFNYTKYLQIRVHNYGRSTAQNCKGIVKVIPNKTHHFMNFPSDKKYKKLVWGSEPDLSDLEDNVDIQKDNWDILHVVFANSSFPSKPVAAPTRYASFSKKGRLIKNELAVQDSFTVGNFLIEITINSVETKTKARFELHVDTDYKNLGMKMLPPSRYEKTKYQLSKIF